MKMYKNFVASFKIAEEPSDAEYWSKKSYRERAIAIEHLRQPSNDKTQKNRARQKIEKVYRVIELKNS